MKNTFYKQLRELRAEKNLSQNNLAKCLNVSKQNISDWENQKSETSFDTLIIIAKFFDVSIDYLILGEELK